MDTKYEGEALTRKLLVILYLERCFPGFCCGIRVRSIFPSTGTENSYCCVFSFPSKIYSSGTLKKMAELKIICVE
jgi:hypothetical protein